MTDTLKQREKGEETKFKLDQEIEFKIHARRNKLLGLWLAVEFGMEGDAASNYAKDVVMADLEEVGDDDILGKIMRDIGLRDIGISINAVRAKMAEFHGIASEQVLNEFPESSGAP